MEGAEKGVRILVLSDLHLGRYADSIELGNNGEFRRENYDLIAQRIKEALARENCRPNLVVVPGDLTSIGSPDEFIGSSELVKTITEKLEDGSQSKIITYGNHDVDWKIGRVVSSNHTERKKYCELGAIAGHIFAPSERPNIPGPIFGSGVYQRDDSTILVLNSGAKCFPLSDTPEEREHEYHHGELGFKQLKWLQELSNGLFRRNSPNILIIHHHLMNESYPSYFPDISLLAESAEVLDKIGALGIDIVIHGHRHHPHLKTVIRTGWKAPITFLGAGSFGVDSAHRMNGKIPNTFHYVEFESSNKNAFYGGTVWTFEAVADGEWDLVRDGMKSLSLDSKQSFGTVSTDAEIQEKVSLWLDGLITAGASYIDCPPFKTLPLEFRSMRIGDLNKIISQSALQKSYRLTGRYPDSCVLIEKSPAIS